MHNWVEAYAVGREQAADRVREARALHRAQPLRPTIVLRSQPGAAATLILARGELLSLQVRGRPWRVRCVAGLLWASAGGRDYPLAAGESVTFAARDTVVIEGLRTSTLRLDRPAATAGLRARIGLRPPMRAQPSPA
jgi:hypothetical protein